jgi:Uma2 family endonuclease
VKLGFNLEIISRKQKFKVREFSGKVYFTYEDIKNLGEFPEIPLLEILNGDLFVVPSPTILHQEISKKLTLVIERYIQEKHVGKLLYAPVDVVLSEEEVVIPDLIVILRNNYQIIGEKNIRGTPDLVIEILSSSRTQDLERKREIYERNGVKEYWIVDPLDKTILVLLLEKKKFLKPLTYSTNSTIQSKVLEGIDLSVNDIVS